MAALSSYYDYDAELEALKRRRMLELQKMLEEQQRRQREEMQKQSILRVLLTPEARQRLTNVRLAHPEIAAYVENLLIAYAQAGRLRIPVDDDTLKQILVKVRAMFKRKSGIRIRRL
ncbi:DNA-binding protein [archaeon]|nr:DNA-binding protein [archaeon]